MAADGVMSIALVGVDEDSVDIVAEFCHPLAGGMGHHFSTAMDSDRELQW